MAQASANAFASGNGNAVANAFAQAIAGGQANAVAQASANAFASGQGATANAFAQVLFLSTTVNAV